MTASLEPVVEVPVACSWAGEPHSSERIRTQRPSIAAVWGYSSLSIMFLSRVSANSRSASSSMNVVTKVARFCRELPSSISSSCSSR